MITTRVCANGKCPSYARVIYTGATRCDFCRWDLKAAQRNAAPVVAEASRPPASVVAPRSESAARGF